MFYFLRAQSHLAATEYYFQFVCTENRITFMIIDFFQVNIISHLEKEFQEKSIAAERKRTEQLQLQKEERKQLEEYYENIQNQLKQTLIVIPFFSIL